MVANRKPTGRAMSMPGGLAMGAAVSIGITLVLAAVLAKLIESEVLGENMIGYGALAILTVASAAGAATAKLKIKRRKLLVGLLSDAVYFAVLVSMTALFFGGEYDAVLPTALAVLGGTGLTFLAEIFGRGGESKRHHKSPVVKLYKKSMR